MITGTGLDMSCVSASGGLSHTDMLIVDRVGASIRIKLCQCGGKQDHLLIPAP